MSKTASDRYISLFKRDVAEYPDSYKAEIREQPEAHARQIIDGHPDHVIDRFTRELMAERRRIARG